MVNLSNQPARCGAVILYSLTCGQRAVPVMGLTTGKKSMLARDNRAAVRAGSSGADLGEIPKTRFVICCFANSSPSVTATVPAARRFAGCRRLASGAGAGQVPVSLTEGGRGSRPRGVRSYIIHSASEKISTLPIPL